KETIYGAMATVYLRPVQTVETIFAESAFLNKASSVTLGYMDREIEKGSNTTDGDSAALSGRYVSGEKYIFEAHYSDGDAIDKELIKTDSKSYGFGIGHYIDDLTSLVLNYSRVDDDGASNKLDNYLLTLKSIVDPTETDRAVGTVAFGISQNTVANTVINLNAGLDYYFGPRLSVGGNIGLVFPNNGNDENTYGLNSRYFFSERISVGASYQHTIFQEEEGAASVDASDTFTLSLTGRI
ncbi:MAG: porin, partial [Pseudomonadales bacterium]